MDFKTKEEAVRRILEIGKEYEGQKKDLSFFANKLGWKDWTKDEKHEFLALFGKVEKISGVFDLFPEWKTGKSDGGNMYAVFNQIPGFTFIQEPGKHADTVFTQPQISEKDESPAKPENSKPENLHSRIKELLAVLNSGLYEKEELLRLSLLAVAAGESVFLLGPPGCAKSMIARRIAEAFKTEGDGRACCYETLLNQFSNPDEVFGPVSIKALSGELKDQNGKEEYRRNTEQYLPTADVAFLDEIWKASPAILNSLLTIINERKYHNGSRVVDVPLKALFAASNELPAENQGLEALYDRFVLRLCVGFIEDEDIFFDMVEDPPLLKLELSAEQEKLLISVQELESWKALIDAVSLSQEAKSVIGAVRKEMSVQNKNRAAQGKACFEVSDRRWKKIVRILKASAFLNGRAEVDLMDCQLIKHCIWSTKTQREDARAIIEKCIEQNGLDCDAAIEDITGQLEEFAARVDEEWYKLVTRSEIDPSGTEISRTTKQKRKFSAIRQETKQKVFDKFHYAPLKSQLLSQINNLKAKKERTAAPFKANLFADQYFCRLIMAKYAQTIRELEDAQVTLDKHRAKYFDSTASGSLGIGDVILNTGIVVSAAETASFPEDEKKDAVAVVCAVGTKTYAMGLKWGWMEMKWDDLEDFCSRCGEGFPKEYSAGWMVPDKDTLNDIYKNKDSINKSLENIKYDVIRDEKYWSSSVDKEGAPFYQNFEGGGVLDHTTKDHEYAVCIIREWEK